MVPLALQPLSVDTFRPHSCGSFRAPDRARCTVIEPYANPYRVDDPEGFRVAERSSAPPPDAPDDPKDRLEDLVEELDDLQRLLYADNRFTGRVVDEVSALVFGMVADHTARAIENARRSVHLEMYIIRADAPGRALADLLVRKAREGVRVRILYDWLGGLGKTPVRFWRRLVAPTGMFDASKRRVCQVRIVRTNTPLQALTLMNDVTYVEAARALAEVVRAGTSDDGELVTGIFERVLSRPPDAVETRRLRAHLTAMRAFYAGHPQEARALARRGGAAE